MNRKPRFHLIVDPSMSSHPRVLFLCVHNSARSQIAEGLLRALAGDRFDVFSAGSEPTQISSFAISAMQERGIDISPQRSKNLDEFVHEKFDYVITLCAEQVCPVFLNATTRLHWALPDPSAAEGDAETKLAAFRKTMTEIENRLRDFLASTTDDK